MGTHRTGLEGLAYYSMFNGKQRVVHSIQSKNEKVLSFIRKFKVQALCPISDLYLWSTLVVSKRRSSQGDTVATGTKYNSAEAIHQTRLANDCRFMHRSPREQTIVWENHDVKYEIIL